MLSELFGGFARTGSSKGLYHDGEHLDQSGLATGARNLKGGDTIRSSRAIDPAVSVYKVR